MIDNLYYLCYYNTYMSSHEEFLNSIEQVRLIERRTDILDAFGQDPTNDAVWQQAYDLVRTEVSDPMDGAAASTIPADELIGFADKVRATTPDERYALTTEQASNGEQWFDILRTFSSPQLARAKLVVLQHGFEDPDHVFTRALDVGTGTGKSLATLEAVAHHVVGLDRNADVLKVAAERKGEATELIRGDVATLPFDDESFDLVASGGLVGALDRSTSIMFYKELERVLTHGGVYIDGTYALNEQGYLGQEMQDIPRASKSMLADMIVDTVSGKLDIADHLGNDERQDLLESLGLQEAEYGVEDEVFNDGTITRVRVIVKS